MEIQDEETKLEFLVTGSYEALPSSYVKLRSYLNIHSSNLANLHGLKLPECFTKTNLTCLQCFLPWSYETCSIKLLPVKKHKKSFSKTKTDSRKASSELTSRNHLVLKCKICNGRSHFYLPKIEKSSKVVVQEENKVGRKKKRKKKDKTCGLRHLLETSLEKYKPLSGSINKPKSSTSNHSGATNLTAGINRNVQQADLKVKNFRPVPQKAAKKILQTLKSKNTTINQHNTKLQCKTLKKKNKNLQKLQKVIQRQKEPVKKTLKDFLTVI